MITTMFSKNIIKICILVLDWVIIRNLGLSDFGRSMAKKNKGRPSINAVTHFLRLLTPPSPLLPILLNRLME